jgi:uncharacterized membrane protein SpoIIM required for sporulation
MLKNLNISVLEFLFPLSIWIFGVLAVAATQLDNSVIHDNFQVVNITIIENSFLFDFFIIFLNNFMLGLLLVYLGYFSFGLFSLFSTCFNSFMFGSLILDFLKYNSIIELLNMMIHALFEIVSFSIFAAIGLKNLWIIGDVFDKPTFELTSLPRLNCLYLLIGLLVLSSVLESFFRN